MATKHDNAQFITGGSIRYNREESITPTFKHCQGLKLVCTWLRLYLLSLRHPSSTETETLSHPTTPHASGPQ